MKNMMNRFFLTALIMVSCLFVSSACNAEEKTVRAPIAALPQLPAPTGSTTPAGWLDDYSTAVSIAKSTNRPIMVFFTGSDWCGWCKRLRQDVLDTPEFQTYATKNLVMLYVDSPGRVRLPAALVQHNQTLKTMLRQSGGVPNTIILTSDGSRIGNISGYRKDFREELNKIIKSAGFTPVK